MEGRLILILCLGLLQAYFPVSMVNGQNSAGPVVTRPPATTPKKPNDFCMVYFPMNSSLYRVLNKDEVQKYDESLNGNYCVDEGDDAIICRTDRRYNLRDCQRWYWKLEYNQETPSGSVFYRLADWFLQYQHCYWQFPIEIKNGEIEFKSEGSRAKAEHFHYFGKKLEYCRVEKDRKVAVCEIYNNSPCEAKSLRMETIVRMKRTEDCDEKCVGRFVEAHAARLKICILKFKFDESTSSVTFLGNAVGSDYDENILDSFGVEYLNFDKRCKLYPLNQKSIFFCRSNDSSTCAADYHNGNSVLNFFDKLDLSKEVTSKMMHSVLKSDICLWRLSYELDENKEVHFDDYGNRLTEYQYREKIDFCVNDKRKKTITCIIANKPCELSSIQDFQFSVQPFEELEAKSQKKISKFRRARNRFGPCIAHFNQENCNIKGLSIEHSYFPIDVYRAPHLVTPNMESFHCWVTYEQMMNHVIDNIVSEYKGDQSIKPCTGIYRTAEFGKLDDLEKKWKKLTGGAEDLKTKQEIYYVFMKLKLSESDNHCNVIDSTVKFAGDCVLSNNGLITCAIPLGKECSPNYFTNGPGLDSLITIPTFATCSKQEILDPLDNMWLNLNGIDTKKSDDSYDERKVIWEIATTTIPSTIDPNAFINNPSINSSGEIMYPPVEIEFKDPPSKEEIKARREALTGRKNETRENNMGKRLSVLSVLLLQLPLFCL